MVEVHENHVSIAACLALLQWSANGTVKILILPWHTRAHTDETTVRTLRSGTDHRTRWYPVLIEDWDDVLNGLSYGEDQLLPDRDIRRNIAYNLQYLEYLAQTLAELNLSSVLITQTYKSYIVVAGGVIESLLHFTNVLRGGKKKRFKDILDEFRETSSLGSDNQLYNSLDRVRNLRNKVHLHEFRDDLTTDYVSFTKEEFNETRKILYKLVKNRIFGLPKEKLKFFEFLNWRVPQK